MYLALENIPCEDALQKYVSPKQAKFSKTYTYFTDSSYYDYDPSKGAAIAFAILYTASFIYTVAQYIWLKSWFWLFMVLAAASKFYYVPEKTLEA